MNAFCFSGHIRGADKEVAPTFECLRNLHGDVYISTWSSSGINSTFWAGDKDGDTKDVDEESIMQRYRPSILDVEKRSQYDYLNHLDFPMPTAHGVNVLNTLLMFKKIKRSIDLAVKSKTEYDVIFRTRFDLQSLSLPNTITCEENTIYGKISPNNGFFSDVFFYGKPEVMSRCIPDENFYTDEIISTSLNAEEILYKYLKKNDIEYKEIKDLHYRIRDVDF